MLILDHLEMTQDIGNTQDSRLDKPLLEPRRVANFDCNRRNVVLLHRSASQRSVWRGVMDNDLGVLEASHVSCGRVLHVGAHVERVDASFGGRVQINQVCKVFHQPRHQVV